MRRSHKHKKREERDKAQKEEEEGEEEEKKQAEEQEGEIKNKEEEEEKEQQQQQQPESEVPIQPAQPHQEMEYGQQQPGQQQPPQPVSHPVVKAVGAATAGGSMLLLSGLTLAGTVIALTIATPLLVIFSPVLVPAAITVFLVAAGFVTSGGFGVAALSVLSWMYKYLTGKHPVGADRLDQARARLAQKAREVKDTAQHRVEQASS